MIILFYNSTLLLDSAVLKYCNSNHSNRLCVHKNKNHFISILEQIYSNFRYYSLLGRSVTMPVWETRSHYPVVTFTTPTTSFYSTIVEV